MTSNLGLEAYGKAPMAECVILVGILLQILDYFVIFLSLSLVYAMALTLHPKPGILEDIQVHGTVSMWGQIKDPKPSM